MLQREFLNLPLRRNFAAKIIKISVGIFWINSFTISDNFHFGISADWKIWEIVGGGDKALRIH